MVGTRLVELVGFQALDALCPTDINQGMTDVCRDKRCGPSSMEELAHRFAHDEHTAYRRIPPTADRLHSDHFQNLTAVDSIRQSPTR